MEDGKHYSPLPSYLLHYLAYQKILPRAPRIGLTFGIYPAHKIKCILGTAARGKCNCNRCFGCDETNANILFVKSERFENK